jgi:SnoaL-like domain
VQLWELEAREAIRDTIARYNQAGDRGEIARMVETFCPDGVLETGRDGGTWTGRDAIARRLGGARPAAPRQPCPGQPLVGRHHIVSNICFDDVRPDGASVSSYFAVVTRRGLDHFGRYLDRLVPVDGQWLLARRVVVRDWQQQSDPPPGTSGPTR